jgi:hypothetical protein
MRRSYISPEYINQRVYGTFNMIEESNFFSAKMLEIEDSISISTEDITYYQNNNGEQLELSVESSGQPLVYSVSNDKNKNHTLLLDETQSKTQKEKNTKWVLTINSKSLLNNYLFAIMKKWRTFEGIRNDMTSTSDVSQSLKNYIDFNVYNRYKIKGVDLYISYRDLRNQNVLRWKNTWSQTALSPSNKYTKIQTETASDGSQIRMMFSQEKPSDSYNFEYFFNLNFEKL